MLYANKRKSFSSFVKGFFFSTTFLCSLFKFSTIVYLDCTASSGLNSKPEDSDKNNL
jgi:hypothetical protein